MVIRFLVAGLALSVGADRAAAADPASQISVSGLPSLVIPLTRTSGGKMLLNAKIQGQSVTLLLDTGASEIIDVGVAARLGLTCTPTQETGYSLIGSVSNATATSINIDLGGLDIWQLRAICLDLSGLRGAYQQLGLKAPDGVLSADVLAVLRARIDFDRQTLELRRPTKKSAAEELQRQDAEMPRTPEKGS